MPVAPKVNPDIFRSASKPQEWEMLTWFTLPFGEPDQPAFSAHLLQPVVEALRPLGVEECLIDEVSQAVAAEGESLRGMCPEGGRMKFVNMRVMLAGHPHKAQENRPGAWGFYIIRQLSGGTKAELDDPCAYIDLHLYRTA